MIESIRRVVREAYYRHKTTPAQLVRTHRLRHTVFIDKPLILISQVQRSGGTMSGGLLDGHTEIYSHPHELWIGRRKSLWPRLDLTASPAAWFDSLKEMRGLHQASTGYTKIGMKHSQPFMFAPALQRRIFLQAVRERRPRTQRQVLDCYATSYFNAWLDYQGLYRDASKVKYWSAFAARLSQTPGQVDAFFADYPDGFLVSIVRDPVAWYASASHHSKEYVEKQKAISLWSESTRAALTLFEKYPRSVVLLDFTEIIRDIEKPMRIMCRRVGIGFESILKEPTFNLLPLASNSSFERGQVGEINTGTLFRGDGLDAATKEWIENETGALYRQALETIRSTRNCERSE